VIQITELPFLGADGFARVNHMRTEYNVFRNARGLLPFKYHDGAAAVAEAHAKDMHTRGFFAHVNPDGLGQGDRLRAAGISCYASENIGGGAFEAPPLLNAWINSSNPGHLSNLLLLSPQFTHYAIGRWQTYWVMLWLGGLS
jgi:uncharacterized protein YkwD